MLQSLVRPVIMPGLLSGIGPFAIDMHLPAMPGIGADLATTVRAMQGTITACFVAFGLAQLIYGPWADQAGRKPPLYAGIAVWRGAADAVGEFRLCAGGLRVGLVAGRHVADADRRGGAWR